MQQSTQDTAQNIASHCVTNKIGDFRLSRLVGSALAKFDSSDGVVLVDNPTEANYVLLEFELPSGDRVTARPSTQYVLYNNQGQVLSEIIDQGYGYVNPDEGVAFTSTEEKANLVRNGIMEYTSYPVGFTHISKMILSEFVETFRLYLGDKDYATHDMRSQNVVNCTTRNDYSNLGSDDSVVKYIELVNILSGGFTECFVSEVEDRSSLSVLVGTNEYNIKLSCDSVSDSNPLEKIVNRFDLTSIYDVKGETVLLGSSKFARKKTSYDVLGKNKAESLSIALKE